MPFPYTFPFVFGEDRIDGVPDSGVGVEAVTILEVTLDGIPDFGYGIGVASLEAQVTGIDFLASTEQREAQTIIWASDILVLKYNCGVDEKFVLTPSIKNK